jgi:hypothetical protein
MERRQRQIQNRRLRDMQNTFEQYQKAEEVDELRKRRVGNAEIRRSWMEGYIHKKNNPSPGNPPFLSRCLVLLDT